MKTFKNIIALLLVVVVFTACKNDKTPEVVTVENEAIETTNDAIVELDPNATYAKAEFTIEGMTCAMGCAKTIEKKMAKLEGVKSAKVDFDKKLAMVEYDEAKVTTETLEEVVKKSGDMYSVKDMKTVESFDGDKKACDKDCKKACCANKTEVDASAKEATKSACGKDCKMPCCADKAKA